MTTTILQPSEFNQVISGDLFLNTNTVEIDEDGNVVSDTLTASTRLTRTGIGILNNLLNGVDFTGILFNSAGFAYQSLTSLASITWENLSVKIQAIAAITQATNATTLNINNAVRIQNGETDPTAPLQYIQIISDTDGHNKLSLSGSIGTANQVLASGGLNGSLAWVTQSGGVATYGTLAQTLNEGNIADQDINMDNNDFLNVRTIENLDSSGYEGVMNAQQNYTQKITPASTQGWGVETWENGAYNYVQDTAGNYTEMVASNGAGLAPYDRPVMEIVDVTNDKQLIINSSQIRLGTQTGGTVAPTANAFLGTDGSGDLQYVSSAPTNSTLETVLGNSTPEGDAGGKPINDCGAITFSKKSGELRAGLTITSEDTGDFGECLSINSTISTGSKTFRGKFMPIVVGAEVLYIPLYENN